MPLNSYIYIYIYKVDDMIVYVLTIVRDLSWGWGGYGPPPQFLKKKILVYKFTQNFRT